MVCTLQDSDRGYGEVAAKAPRASRTFYAARLEARCISLWLTARFSMECLFPSPSPFMIPPLIGSGHQSTYPTIHLSPNHLLSIDAYALLTDRRPPLAFTHCPIPTQRARLPVATDEPLG